MNKRQRIFQKYNGLCAYTGKPLGEDWQIDHVTSKYRHQYHVGWNASSVEEYKAQIKEVNKEENLVPAIKIINHYKRSLDLEGFRHYMLYFHKRLAKLPKKTSVLRTKKRIEYMNKVAELFDITVDKSFSGIFYFEKSQ